MALEVKVPSVGESITEALLAQWYKENGDYVRKDEPLFVIETDKVTLEVTAEADGMIHILVEAGETVAIGAVVGTIDTTASESTRTESTAGDDKFEKAPTVPEQPEEPAPAPSLAPVVSEAEKAVPPAVDSSVLISPSVERLIATNGLSIDQIPGTGPAGRITRGDVLLAIEASGGTPAPAPKGTASAHALDKIPSVITTAEHAEAVTREPMSPLRRRIAEHLLNAKQNTAMLTTFNDIDMQNVMQMRSRYKEAFKSKYEVSLGFMSFFIKATIGSLKEFPQVNAFLEDGQIVYHHYTHIGVAIGSGRGLVVPVIRHADRLSFAELEQAIVDFVGKVKNNRLELADLEGGTFTITNGGVFGSLLSTPILNMPQSGILGMHRIEKRPVVVNDEIVIRPMMYVALSYDHRIIDGREAVTFLRRIKECIENPERMMMEI